jgi:MFS superfamily sulfate permease-like transporter
MTPPLVTNLGSRGRRRRYLMGAAGVVLTVLLGAVFLALGLARGARLALFIPLLIAALGFMQAHSGT